MRTETEILGSIFMPLALGASIPRDTAHLTETWESEMTGIYGELDLLRRSKFREEMRS